MHTAVAYDFLRLVKRPHDQDWRPPPTIATWGLGVPLETIRFAGANRLCIRLRYSGSERVIEPYSLRRTRDGNLLLHALRADTGEHRSYRVDRIERIEVTTQAFRPKYVIEFTRLGPITIQPTTTHVAGDARAHRSGSARSTVGTHRSPRRQRTLGPVYVIACPVCGKQFRRARNNLVLRPHKAPGGWPCSGRRGYLVGIR